VIGMGWTGKEELIVSMEDGNVLMYDIHGKFIKSFNMGGKVRYFFVYSGGTSSDCPFD
jgi:hypothetical protein